MAGAAAAHAEPLALTDVAHSELRGWRRHQDLIDALPYVDARAPAEKQAVDRLIEEEVRAGRGWAAGMAPGAAPTDADALPPFPHAGSDDAQQQDPR